MNQLERATGQAQGVADRRLQRQVLATGDAAAIATGFAVVTSVAAAFGGFRASELLYTVAAVSIGLLSLYRLGLWNAHKIAVRSVELGGLVRASGAILGGILVIDRIVGPALRLRWIVVAAVLAGALLILWRSVVRSYFAIGRRQGRFVQPTIVVGTDERAMELVRLAAVHPEAGMAVVGVIGNRHDTVAAGHGDLWLGELADVRSIVATAAAERIVVSSGDIAAADLAALIAAEHDGGPEVVVHAGLPGIDASRVTVSAAAHATLLHVESGAPSLVARAAKRTFDIVVAGALLLVAAPVLAIVAVLVKKEDGGPVLFRQQRVGRDDAEFGMFKFRTMCVDAEAKLAAMQADNQRSGPLFKLARDPRVTRIGHVLRRTSLDELPQLLNVLTGDMSLVGPRPALRREVDEFPAELHARHAVRPGITGLWQVEARDNPEFEAYQRLDLHYVENWSPALDVAVLLGTAEQLLLRPFASRHHGEMAAVATVATVAPVADSDASFARAA